MCKLEKKDASSESVTKMTENGEEIYANSNVRKRQKVDNVYIKGDSNPNDKYILSERAL